MADDTDDDRPKPQRQDSPSRTRAPRKPTRTYSKPGARERALMRRRLRALIRERELLLRDLGGLAMEMHRRNEFRESLLREKADDAALLDAEIRLLRRGLREDRGLSELGLDGDRPPATSS